MSNPSNRRPPPGQRRSPADLPTVPAPARLLGRRVPAGPIALSRQSCRQLQYSTERRFRDGRLIPSPAPSQHRVRRSCINGRGVNSAVAAGPEADELPHRPEDGPRDDADAAPAASPSNWRGSHATLGSRSRAGHPGILGAACRRRRPIRCCRPSPGALATLADAAWTPLRARSAPGSAASSTCCRSRFASATTGTSPHRKAGTRAQSMGLADAGRGLSDRRPRCPAGPRDPIWSLLAELAGRPLGAPPGRGFRAPACGGSRRPG